MEVEYIDIVDENNQILGTRKSHEEIHKLGLWHRTIQVWIYNKKGEILLQLRDKDKEFYPNKWDISVAGHVQSGEDALFAAIRETLEELGIELTLNDFELYAVYKDEDHSRDLINNEFVYIYLVKYNKNIEKDKINKYEIEDIKFINIKDLSKELSENKVNYVSHDNLWSDIINTIQERLDS